MDTVQTYYRGIWCPWPGPIWPMSYFISSCTVWPSSAWPPNAQHSSCSLMILCYYTSMESLSPLTKACLFFRLQLNISLLSENFFKSLHIPIFCPFSEILSHFVSTALVSFLYTVSCIFLYLTPWRDSFWNTGPLHKACLVSPPVFHVDLCRLTR